jgi:hypothetical protein
MTTIDQIAQERRRFLASPRTARDWLAYVTAIERLRRQREGR